MELNERQTKTRTGANLSDVREVAPKIFECQGDRNPIEVYEVYAEKRPESMCGNDDPFYLAPRTIPVSDPRSTQWFLRQKVGMKKLSSFMKTMKEKGELDGNKRLTNHSARKYLVQKLRENNVEANDICHISGHKNVQSIENYSHISENKQRQISNLLSDTSGSGRQLVPVNLPRTTSTVTAPSIDEPVFASSQGNAVSSSFSSQTSLSNRINSMFFGARLHVQNLNVYMCDKH